MGKRRFISVDRAGRLFYWDCPGKCGEYHQLDRPGEGRLIIHRICKCGYEYEILQITSITQTGARLLIEENK